MLSIMKDSETVSGAARNGKGKARVSTSLKGKSVRFVGILVGSRRVSFPDQVCVHRSSLSGNEAISFVEKVVPMSSTFLPSK